MVASFSSILKSLADFAPHIHFFSEGLRYRVRDLRKVGLWLDHVARSENHELGELSIVLCTDEYLLQLNRDHLQHDYYTDIITFDYHTQPLSGDLFISLERVRDNAKQRKLKTVDELHRVMVHGLLHLMGYTDKTDEERQIMRGLEDSYLTLRRFV